MESFLLHSLPHIRALRERVGSLTSSRTVYMLKQAMLFFSQLLVDQITYLSNTFLISRMNMPTRSEKKK